MKTVVVTGSTRGIGFYSVRDLARKEDVEKVILTFRKEEAGEKAVKRLTEEFKIPKEKLDMYKLDVTSAESIEAFKLFLKEKYGKIDVLLHNAGVLTPSNLSKKEDILSEDITVDTAKFVFGVNYFGAKAVVEGLSEVVDKKIVIVASQAGYYLKFTDEKTKDKFYKAKNFEELEAGIKHFYDSIAADGKEGLKKHGYDTSSWYPTYSLSKLCVIKMTQFLAKREGDNGRIICCLCPGYVVTDFNRGMEEKMNGGRPEDTGGERPVNVAVNSTREYHGAFYVQGDQRLDFC